MVISSQHHLELLQQHFGAWSFQINPPKLLYSPKWLAQTTGRDETAIRPLRELLRLVHPTDRHKLIEQIRQLCIGKRPRIDCEIRLQQDEKEFHWIELSAVIAAYAENGAPEMLLGSARSINSRAMHEEALYDLCQKLQASETRYRALLHDAKSPILVIDCNSKAIVDVNSATTRVTGFSKDELLKMKADELILDPHNQCCRCDTADYSVPGQELSLQCKSGKRLQVELSCSNVSIQDRKLQQCIVHDITLRKRTEDSLRYMACHDPLTGLPNRTLLGQRLEDALEKARKHENLVAVCFVDLNKFKQVNDVFGHDVGDHILTAFAKRLENSIRSSDTAARLGGDEFIFVLGNIYSVETIKQVIEKAIEVLNVPYRVDAKTIKIECSIGVSIFPYAGADPMELLHNADQAMYHAKNNALSYHIYSTTQGTTGSED